MSVDPDVWAYLYVFAVISFGLAVSTFWIILDWITLIVTRPFTDGVAEELVNGEIRKVPIPSARTRFVAYISSWRSVYYMLRQPTYLVNLFKLTSTLPSVRREVAPALLKSIINIRFIFFLVWIYLAFQMTYMTFSYDPHTILGIDKNADKTAVSSAYRKLARKYRPDREQAPEVAAEWMKIAKAYQALKSGDEDARADLEGMTNDGTSFGVTVPAFLLGKGYKKVTAVIYIAALLGLVVFAVHRISRPPDRHLVERLQKVVGFATDYQSVTEQFPFDVTHLQALLGIPVGDALGRALADVLRPPLDFAKLDPTVVEACCRKAAKTIADALPAKQSLQALETAEMGLLSAPFGQHPVQVAANSQVAEWASRGLFLRANSEPDLSRVIAHAEHFKWELAVALAAREVAVGQSVRHVTLQKLFEAAVNARKLIEMDRIKAVAVSRGATGAQYEIRSQGARLEALKQLVAPFIEHWLALMWATQQVQHATTLLATRGAGVNGIGEADRYRPLVECERKRLERQRERYEAEMAQKQQQQKTLRRLGKA